MTDTVARVAGLNDDQLIAMHKRIDEHVSADAAIIEAHHLVAVEMLKRNIPHGHVNDAWAEAAVLVEKASVSSPDEIDAPAGMEKAWAQTLADGGTVSVLLTTDGYVLKADPTVSDVHVDAVMGSGRKRPRKFMKPVEMQKTIKEEDGKYIVYSEDLTRRFGTYNTMEEAEERLAQIERFKKQAGYSVPEDVQNAAKRALKWISEGKAGDGFTSVGRGRARQLANGGTVSRAVLVKMRAYFARHGEQRGDHAALDDGEPTPWRVAWDAWGGDPGRTWSNKILDAVEKAYDPEDMLTDKERALYDAYETVAETHGEFTLLEAHYMSADQNPFTDQGMNCANCVFFEGGGGCEILTEQVDPMGLCKLWVISANLLEKAANVLDDEETYLAALSDEDKEFYADIARSLDAGSEPDFVMAKRGNPEALRDYWRGGGKGKISWGAGGDFTSCVAAVGKYMTSEQAKGYCAIRHREVTGMWPGDKRNRTKKSREALAKFTLPGGATYEFSVPVESVGALEPISKHGSHNQKAHAGKSGVSGDVSPEIAESIIERVRANGGLSVSMVDGSEPPGGYMVARTGVKAAIVDADDFYDKERGTAALGSFLKDNKAELTGGDYLGVWHDTDGGKVYLDVSQNVSSRSTAIRLGEERNQISIWDVVEGQEIPTGGTGEIEKAGAFTGDQITGSVKDDGRRDRSVRGGDLGEVDPEVSKHLQGKHDQRSHANGGAQQMRRKEIIERGETKRPLPRDARGRVINPDATGGYKAGISETIVFKGETLTPEHSLWHHLEGNPKTGYRITAERAAVHSKIVQDATRGVPRSDDPTFHMLGGGPAAGKSTAIDSGLADVPKGDKAVQINADSIKEGLPEYDRMRFSSNDDEFFNAAAFSHEESSFLAKQVQKAAFENKQDVVLDGTGDSKYATLEKKVGQARDAGYKVSATYATVPTADAVTRSNKRSLKPTERRFVPEAVVRGTHKDVSAVFPEAVRKGLFDSAKLIDTSVLGEEVLIGETSGGSFVVRDQAKWNSFVAKGSE